MTTAKLFESITALNIEPKDYIVVGSGVLGALELREVADIDIIVSEQVMQEFEKKSGWTPRYFDDGTYYLLKDDYELGQDWDSRDNKPNLTDLKSTEIVINDVPFLGLERLRSWKQRKSREKDLKDIELIDKYLTNE